MQVSSPDLLLLGSQTMDVPGYQGVQAVPNLPKLVEGLTKVIDFDIDGKAAKKVDLSRFNAKQGPFGTIADFGTLEHVDGISNALRNVFEWLSEDGYAIHVNPSEGYKDDIHHKGVPRFTTDFWKAYAKLTGMKVVLIDYNPAYAESTAIECRCVLQKTKESKSPTKAKIDSLINKYLK